MIVEAMSLLLKQLNDSIAQADGTPGAPAQALWGNIAQLDRTEIATELDNRLVLTLVNIEEERTLKNGKPFTNLRASEVGYSNRIIYLNLYLLFTANYRNYATALQRLTQVLTFFQGKQRFTFANSPGSGTPQSALTDFALIMDLISLSVEEVNHLWAFLGGKQSPFVVYRGRMVTINDHRVLESGGRIQDVELTSRSVTP